MTTKFTWVPATVTDPTTMKPVNIRALYVNGRPTSLHVREWSPEWWYVIENTAPLTTDARRTGKHGSTLGTRVRRWRSPERAEAVAIATWTQLHKEEK